MGTEGIIENNEGIIENNDTQHDEVWGFVRTSSPGVVKFVVKENGAEVVPRIPGRALLADDGCDAHLTERRCCAAGCGLDSQRLLADNIPALVFNCWHAQVVGAYLLSVLLIR